MAELGNSRLVVDGRDNNSVATIAADDALLTLELSMVDQLVEQQAGTL